jgi:hypothetical protein
MSEPQRHGDDLIRYWDGIAAALQVSVKTAQRYEKDLGLPVRRKQGPRGTVVYAFQHELKEWLTANPVEEQMPEVSEPDLPVRKRRPFAFGRLGWWIAGSVLATILVAGVALKLRHPAEPAMWRLEQQRLGIFDGRGNLIWYHTFDQPLLAPFYQRQGGTGVPQTLGQFVDLDGDGRKEFLFLAVGPEEPQKSFYCFNADGTVRFSVIPGRTLTQTVRFGEEDFSPPFSAYRFFVAAEARGRKSVFVISEDPWWYPAVVQKFSPSGERLGEYWHAGRLLEVSPIEAGGRRLLFVGGTNNERHAASLSVLDLHRPTGHGPAANPKYRCRNCPSGEPIAYFLFPEMEVSRVLNAWPTVWHVRLDSPDRISVTVLQTREPLSAGGPAGLIGSSVYTFDTKLRLRRAELVEGYRATHSALELMGRLDHPVGARDEQELLPVLRWNGTRYEPAGIEP